MKERFFHTMMREVCGELEIKFEILAQGYVLELSKNGQIHRIFENRFDINDDVSGRIASNKYVTYEVLKKSNVPVVKHTFLCNKNFKYINNNIDIWEILKEELLKFKRIVLKPNVGKCGKFVYQCNTLLGIETALNRLFQKYTNISVCPYEDILVEYRAIYLYGKIYYICGKQKPQIIGDGKSTVEELLNNLNLANNLVVEENLQKLNKAYVPKVDEIIYVSWKHNVNAGATYKAMEKGFLYNKISGLAVKTANAIGLNFATIDIIHTSSNQLKVLEVGTSISLPTEEKVIFKQIYKKALEKLFY